jgi:O-antigen biosynthesis protein
MPAFIASAEDRERQKRADVKSRLLPLPSFVARLERLIELLPRKTISVRLQAVKDVVAIDDKSGEYRSTSGNPAFAMTLAPINRKGAWYYLEAALTRNNGNRDAAILIEFDKLSDKEPARNLMASIPSNLRGSVREVFYLPSNVSSLHWRPTAAPGFFSQSPLLIHEITCLESFFRRFYRVLFDLWRFRRHTSASRCGLSFWRALWSLQDAYRRSAEIRIQRAMGNDYQAFLERNEAPKERIQLGHKLAKGLSCGPLISLVIPLRHPIPRLFVKTLESINDQVYANWELLLVGDRGAIDAETRTLIEESQAKDKRIRFVLQAKTGACARSLNRALECAKGQYFAILRQHDLIQPSALFFVAEVFGEHSDCQLIYTDEDHVDEAGRRTAPIFKPDWNPDLLLSHDYFSKLCVYRRALATELGGYRDGYDGAEEYELLLRCLANASSASILHLPKVLYSRRIFANDEAERSSGASHQAHEGGRKALQEHLAASGALVESGPAPGLYRVRHPLPKVPPLVSLIIPTRDQVDVLRKCVESIRLKTNYPNWEMLIIDNQSRQADTLSYFEELQKDCRIKIFQYAKPFNYSAINNFAVQMAKGEMLALLNNDVEAIVPEWLSEMTSHALRPGIGAVGAKLLYENGAIQHAGVILGIGGVAGHAHKYVQGDAPGYCYRACLTQNFSAVTGACLVVRKAVYQEVEGLNQTDLAIAFNDIDFCLKVRAAGYRNLYTPYALLYHHESLTRGRDDTLEKQTVFRREFEYMKRTWGEALKSDPAYNCNLTLEFENFSFS